jgi:chromosome segregation ATPase
MNYKNTNIFKVLAEYNEYDDFEDIMPYIEIVDGVQWKSLEPSPIAKLINQRFGYWYTGKLTWREINSIKERMDKAENDLETYRDKIYDNKRKLIDLLREQERLCRTNDECRKKLDKHLEICSGDGKYRCEKDFVSYDCQFKENGRCSHYYEIKHIEESLENYEYTDDSYKESYIDLQIIYERALAVKENRLKEYQQQLEDDFDDWSHELSMRMC